MRILANSIFELIFIIKSIGVHSFNFYQHKFSLLSSIFPFSSYDASLHTSMLKVTIKKIYKKESIWDVHTTQSYWRMISKASVFNLIRRWKLYSSFFHYDQSFHDGIFLIFFHFIILNYNFGRELVLSGSACWIFKEFD